MLTAVVILGFIFSGVKTDNEYFAIARSPLLLDAWAEAEIKFMDRLKFLPINQAKVGGQLVTKMTSYATDFVNCTKNLRNFGGTETDQKKVSAVTYNPLASYRMIRRLVHDLPSLKESLLDSDVESVTKVHAYDALSVFPGGSWLEKQDLTDAIAAILRISYVYQLKPEDLAQGIIIGMNTGIQLEAVHCYEIAKESLLQDHYVQSIEWLELALEKLGHGDDTIHSKLIEEAYEEALKKHDEEFAQWFAAPMPKIYDRELLPIRNDPDFKTIRKSKQALLIDELGGDTSPNNLNNYVNYWILCSGGDLRSEELKSQLFCWNERKSHPYLSISPIKMELLSKDPDVVQMYDVIGDQMITKLQDSASGKLVRSQVVNIKGDAPPVTSDVRTSVQSWLSDKLQPDLQVLTRTIEKATGLVVFPDSAGEQFQVAAYTFSGHYDVHVDGFLITGYLGEETNGNRIGTFMYYLQQPELGGQTIFPQGRVAAQPIKGSAVFWYDIKSDGAVDLHTYHGACPVVYGRKWVSNKWIRYFDQFQTKKCALEEDERYSIHLDTRGRW